MRLAMFLLLLAACARQEPPRLDADVVIHVTGEGTVHWSGERVRLADVAARLRQLKEDAKVVVDGASDADWAHVQWVVAIVRAWGWQAVTLTCASRQQVEIPLEFDLHAFGSAPHLRMELRRSKQAGTRFGLGARSTRRLDEARGWINDGGLLMGPIGSFAVEAAGDVSFGDVHAVLVSVSRLGRIHLDVGVERPHLWVMAQDPLPTTDEVFGRRWTWDLARKNLTPLTLPLARAGQQDKDTDPDDRVILSVDPEGRILHRRESLSLEQLTERLQKERSSYKGGWWTRYPETPHAGEEKIAEGVYASKLFVLLRADHDLPWNRVLSIVEALDANGFYKLQFATQRYATLDHSPEDATRVGVERAEVVPSGWPSLACKLQCFLPTAHDDSERFIEVEVGGSGRFRIDGADPRDVAQLASEIKTRYRKFDERKGVTVKGRIRADPDARYQDVISALEAFARAGMEKVDLR